MLTIAKLTTYATFNGDIDGWARAAASDDAARLTDADWYLIDELLTNLATVASGRASAAFAADVERRLQACAPYAIDPAAADAWMVIETRPGLLGAVRGTVQCADALMQPALWRE